MYREVWTPIDKKTLKQLGIHVHFKGSSTTTSRNIPAQSALEAQLLGGSTDASNGMFGSKGSGDTGTTGLSGYANTGLNNAYNLMGQANTAINNTYNPDWNTLGNNYNTSTANNLNNYTNTSNNALTNYDTNANKYLTDYTNSNNNTLGNYNDTMAGISSKYNDVTNGILPSAYAAARKQALNADLTGTVGSKLNSLNSNGILNSSVTTGALNEIDKNASDTLAKNYASDLSTESGLLGNQANNASNIYNTNNGNANTLYGNQTNANNSTYGNTMSNANSLYGNQTSNANGLLTGATAAQTGSYYEPSQLLNYAGNEATPASNLFNTLYSGRMGTSGVTQSTNDGGAGTANLVGTLGSAAIMCFIGETKISTPDGDKNIEDIKVGDKVNSIDGVQTVTWVQEPIVSPDEYMTVIFADKQVTTTAMQPFILPNGDVLAKDLYHVAAEKELVYDLSTTGSNTYYANGFAVRGRE